MNKFGLSNKRTRCFIGLALILLIVHRILRLSGELLHWKIGNSFIHFKRLENVVDNQKLLSKATQKNIFFHETSDNMDLDLNTREACAVESAG